MGKIEYFVSYHFSLGPGGLGFGNVRIALEKPVSGPDAIRDIERFVKGQIRGAENVVVLSWQRFEEQAPQRWRSPSR